MVKIGTPLSPCATKVVLCGSGELGKEFVIELQRNLADQAELSRFTELRAYMQGELMLANQRSEEQHAQLLAKLDRLEANLGTHIEQLLQK